MRILLLLIIFVSTNISLHAQYTEEDNECVAKVIQPAIYGEVEISYPVYTGDNPKMKEKKRKIIIEPGTTRWEKRPSDGNCLSADPDDCIVWALIEERAITKTVWVVDTNKTDDFRLEYVTVTRLLEEGYTEEVPVLCKEDMDDAFIEELINALKAVDYLAADYSNYVYDTRAKAALTKFQQDHDLPIGNLDFETLEMLGVGY